MDTLDSDGKKTTSTGADEDEDIWSILLLWIIVGQPTTPALLCSVNKSSNHLCLLSGLCTEYINPLVENCISFSWRWFTTARQHAKCFSIWKCRPVRASILMICAQGLSSHTAYLLELSLAHSMHIEMHNEIQFCWNVQWEPRANIPEQETLPHLLYQSLVHSMHIKIHNGIQKHRDVHWEPHAGPASLIKLFPISLVLSLVLCTCQNARWFSDWWDRPVGDLCPCSWLVSVSLISATGRRLKHACQNARWLLFLLNLSVREWYPYSWSSSSPLCYRLQAHSMPIKRQDAF